MEFHQPAIIAEALAQTSVHEDWPADLLLGAEKAAKQSSKTIPEVLEDLRADSKLYDSVKFEQGNKLREGMLPNALNELIHHVSQWTVGEDELETKTAEMFNSVIYMTAAAQNPPKQVSSIAYTGLQENLSTHLAIDRTRLRPYSCCQQRYLYFCLQRSKLALNTQQMSSLRMESPHGPRFLRSPGFTKPSS